MKRSPRSRWAHAHFAKGECCVTWAFIVCLQVQEHVMPSLSPLAGTHECVVCFRRDYRLKASISKSETVVNIFVEHIFFKVIIQANTAYTSIFASCGAWHPLKLRYWSEVRFIFTEHHSRWDINNAAVQHGWIWKPCKSSIIYYGHSSHGQCILLCTRNPWMTRGMGSLIPNPKRNSTTTTYYYVMPPI